MLRAMRGSRARRRALRDLAPVPPIPLPPARTVEVPGRGEFFVRDSGGDGPPVLLLHGWMVSADVNWLRSYDALIAEGYRVIAMDHRGHGRGLRAPAPFRLEDCADDAAAVIDALGCGPVIVTGYSMGGPITQLLARRHPHVPRGIVLCATTREWQDAEFQRLFALMWILRIVLTLAPSGFWSTAIRAIGIPETDETAWLTSELSRGSAVALAQAGRELGRFDSRPWLGEIDVPAAVVVTTRDQAVPPRLQRDLAAQLGAATFDVKADHMAAGMPDGRFNEGLLAALAHLDSA